MDTGDRSPGERDLGNNSVNRWSLKPGSRRNHLEEITELSKGTVRHRRIVPREFKEMQDPGQEARRACAKSRELSITASVPALCRAFRQTSSETFQSGLSPSF